MRVGWLTDDPGYRGGAELTMDEFKAAAPDGVEFFTLSSNDVWGGSKSCQEMLDVCVVGNCVTYGERHISALSTRPVVRYWNDLAPHGDPTLKRWLLDNATNVFTSPLHRKAFPWTVAGKWEIVPPPVDLERFREARTGDARSPNACSISTWTYGGKGGFLLNEWAEANETKLSVYGQGPFRPDESEWVTHRGPLEYEDVPRVMASYERFVLLPTKVEPFGRCYVEAFAAGCKVTANGNVGARYFIEEAREKLETAAHDFWQIVERVAS